jgi:D-arabinose 1-dehydrogenase-like Zn-dependent alcohol dehydrogenase
MSVHTPSPCLPLPGLYNLCPDIKFFATPPVDGSLAQHVVHPADLTFKLPEGMSIEEVRPRANGRKTDRMVWLPH